MVWSMVSHIQLLKKLTWTQWKKKKEMDIQRNQGGTKITWGEHKCAQKGVKKNIGKNQMPTKEKPKCEQRRARNTLGGTQMLAIEKFKSHT